MFSRNLHQKVPKHRRQLQKDSETWMQHLQSQTCQMVSQTSQAMLMMMGKKVNQMVKKSLMDQMALVVQGSETGLMRQFVTQELAQENVDQLIRLGGRD